MITMLISVLKSQKTSDSLSNFYIDNKKENRRRIRTTILYFVSHDLQTVNKSHNKLKK